MRQSVGLNVERRALQSPLSSCSSLACGNVFRILGSVDGRINYTTRRHVVTGPASATFLLRFWEVFPELDGLDKKMGCRGWVVYNLVKSALGYCR